MNPPLDGDSASNPLDCATTAPTERDTQRLLAAKKKKDAEKRIRFKAEAKANGAPPLDACPDEAR